MKAVFRVDGNSGIGLGHMSRCLSLAEQLKIREVDCTFISRALPRAVSARILQSGFRLALVSDEEPHGPDSSHSRHPIDAEQDAISTIASMSGPTDWLVVDSYAIDHVWEALLRPHTRWIMAIDDLADRSHNCDIIVDHNVPDSTNNPYADLTPRNCLPLIGPRYALLPAVFGHARGRLQGSLEDRSGILIFFGGGDDHGLTELALTAMTTGPLSRARVTVVVGGSNPDARKLFRMARQRPMTTALGTLPHLADLMSTSALAIGAGGVTSLERICLGLPSLVTTIAVNQIRSTQRLASLGLLRYLGHWPVIDPASIAESTEALLEDAHWRHRSNALGMELVDGRGASRVAQEMIDFSHRS